MNHSTWTGIRNSAFEKVQTRDYSRMSLSERISTVGAAGGELAANREELEMSEAWIPGVEVFQRQIFPQKERGYFSELVRSNDGILHQIGLYPKQWSSALMFHGSAKGFHIHPPMVPDGYDAEDWFRELFLQTPMNYKRRLYDLEQWDVMFFLTGVCEVVLVDERMGLDRRVMRFSICGDHSAGTDHVAFVIPPGVGHALKNIGSGDIIMVYGTSTTFRPESEGRIFSEIENSRLPDEWTQYLSSLEKEI